MISSMISSLTCENGNKQKRAMSLLLMFCLSSVALAHGFGSTDITISARQRMASAFPDLRQQHPSVSFVRPSGISQAPATPKASLMAAAVPSGGAGSTVVSMAGSPLLTEASESAEGPSGFTKFIGAIGSLWGTTGVVYILAKAIKRVLPIALEPFTSSAMVLTPFQWSAYALTAAFFAYYEGYKGFQTKFSPLVVKRSLSLVARPDTNIVMKLLQFVLAPLYSMGLFQATKKRAIVSWCVSIGVAGIVAMVKRLSQPWRAIVDGGVVIGLSWGALSIMIIYLHAWFTGTAPPNTDACLPQP
uniref:Uncharacterized protein n=1 Tax=Craspedostauros australis TaxID=1486917 RepID=A0A7R9WR65_9STRA|mmetsp:Transcript_16795/g.46401  ORF Transcript_16795/g.46401 Transcript_16795/m.46401 type:complete len:302 (+) Transcript_16795:130-1035(+)|eukprot:CAMPEP_0198134710 /NCGR_PEP_ID=MMETSP1442-20131203/60215_1 /TAXON_ID= /ORGANISM="Craspedostauros australis, Strain CCMP3328" /LENGTH=301 /DNA_ID=CAMNT_0043795857 /DNA_START=540 /DNA_END=1445 /DNA_ORIENTATION=-